MYTLEFFSPENDLIERRTALSLQSNIPNMAEYAEAWNKLAADFAAIGFTANAEMCWSNWMRYKEYEPVEVVRLVEGSFAEIIPVPETPRASQALLADETTASTPGIDAPADQLYLKESGTE